MAEVFKAFDSRSGEIVALKRMLPSLDDDDESQDLTPLFQAEARIGSSLRHPHIAQLLDFGRVSEFFYITFEFIDGRDLSVIQSKLATRGEAFDTTLACALGIAMTEALSYAHERRDAEGSRRPVIHRDVSPQNILVSQSGDVKLIDFGVAKDVDGGTGRTQIGTLRGKFGYLAPEQVDGVGVDARTDVFALAVVLWELLAGKRLFHADNEFLAVQRLMNHVPEPLSAIRSDVSSALSDVVAAALSKDAASRPASMASFGDAIRGASGVANVRGHERNFVALMDRLFGDSASHAGPLPSMPGSSAGFDSRVFEEKRTMSGDEKQGGKQDGEVDVFEALSQKRRSLPPPAPSGANLKGTMLGVANPLASAPIPVPPPPAPPPAPPAAPPAAAAPAAPPAAPAALTTPEPPPVVAAAPAPVSWEEDEDEATQVFDKASDAASLMAAAFQQQNSAKKAEPPAAAKTMFGVAAPIVSAPVAPAAPAATMTSTPVVPAVASQTAASAAPNSYALIQSASVPTNVPNPILSGSSSGTSSASFAPPASMQQGPVPSFAPPAQQSTQSTQSTQSNWAMIGALAAVALGAGVYLAMPKYGKVVVNIADSRGTTVPNFEVQLDGETICTSLPCVREKLPIGTKTVSVQAAGFSKPAPKTVSVENGKSSIVDFTLSADAPTPPAPAPAPAPAPVAPAPAAVPAPVVAAPPAPPPAPVPPAAVAPPPAVQAAPALVAPKPAAPAPVVVAPKPAPPPPAAPAPAAKPAFVPSAPAPVAAVAGMGMLTINSVPASSVKVDGKSVGSTPVSNYSVKAGKHTITFENTDEGLTKTIEVDVTAGETKKAIAKLRSE